MKYFDIIGQDREIVIEKISSGCGCFECPKQSIHGQIGDV
jgi:hypothetical protein